MPTAARTDDDDLTPKLRTPRRDTFVLDGFNWSRLPLPRAILIGTRRNFKPFYSAADGFYDFADDVRELVCREEIRPGVIAEWTDWREWARR